MNKIIELTKEQKEKALELIEQGIPRKDISKAIHTRYCNLKAFLEQENIPIKKQGIPLEYYESIFNLYESGLTSREIHEKYYPCFSEDQIGYICKKQGISRRNGKQVHLNHNYFNVIDTEEKAYWLGLLFADGHVRHEEKKGNSWSISLALMKEDKYLVEAFAKAVETDLKVKEYINPTGFQRKDGQPHIECRIMLHSVQMAMDLQRYGVVPQKSLKVSELPKIPQQYMRHFIRGFFDGNGSVTHCCEHNIIKPRILFYSTHAFCEEIKKYLSQNIEANCGSVYDQKNEKVSFISFYGIQDIIKLYDYLYNDATIYMKRKQNKYEEFVRKYRDNYVA